ncbi:MAG: fibronectin type III domain-containing protein [Terriglobia bacterium]
MPPTPKIPLPPRDLVARQVGERVLLRWTLSRLHTDGTRMAGWPRLEIHRAFLPDTTREKQAFAAAAQVAYVIPEQVVESFLHGTIVVFPDVLGAAVLREQASRYAIYAIKAVNPKGQGAGFSNLVAVRVYPVPTPITPIATRVTERAIELRWTPPQRTTSGTPLEAIAGYQVYRSKTGEEGSFALQGTAATARYEDTQLRFGARYFYRIRTLAQFGADTVESDNSVTVEVAARDLFPPPVPTNLIVVAGRNRIDLTWDASPAADLAGYYVYRSRQSGTGYERLKPEPLPAQSFADTGVEAGTRYYYVVTAVDADGNESPFSEEVAATPLAPD